MNFYVTETKSTPLRLVFIYRPPPSQTNKLTVTAFFKEFSTLLEVVSSWGLQFPSRRRW